MGRYWVWANRALDSGMARAGDRAEAPLTGSAVKRASGSALPVYRRSIGTASCNRDEFVAENGVKRPICHIGASDSIPGLVPRLPDRLSYESGQSAGGRIMGEWTAAATKVDKAPVSAQDALRAGFEAAIPAARVSRSAYAGGQSGAPTRDAAGLMRQTTIALSRFSPWLACKEKRNTLQSAIWVRIVPV